MRMSFQLEKASQVRYTVGMDDKENTPQESQPQDKDRNRHEEHMLLEWDAPSRPFKKRDREYYTTIGIIVFLLSLILFFAGQFLFIAVLISLAFVSYVLASVPPDHHHIAITSFGIHVGEQMYYWEELGRFWFSEKYKSNVLHVETARAFPSQLILLLGDKTVEEVKKTMLKNAVFEVPRPTWLDNAAKWMTEKFPLEKES
jgi:hypothetical protein